MCVIAPVSLSKLGSTVEKKLSTSKHLIDPVPVDS